MKKRLVFWGKKEDAKALLAFELLEKEAKYKTHIFNAEGLTEDFVKQMNEQWRNGGELLFPEHTELPVRDLNLAQSMIPEGYELERAEIAKRAQTEWNFMVASNQLRQSYADQLDDIKEKITEKTDFDKGIWNDLKSFWSEIQGQIRERNLIREHGDSLRDYANDLFSQLKEMRKKADDTFRKISAKHTEEFKTTIGEIEDKIQKGISVHPIFEDLKDAQRKLKDSQMTRKDKDAIWQKIDQLFKELKSKRGNKSEQGNSERDRAERRLTGLEAALEKMEKSINRDERDFSYQTGRADNTLSQIEQQLRGAKTEMIKSRIESKKVKLEDMKKTKDHLIKKIERLKKREAAEAEKQAVKQEKERIKLKIKENISAQTEANAQDPTILEAEKLMQASKEKGTTEETPILDNIQDGIMDLVDTMKAVATVIEDKIESGAKALAEDITEVVQDLKEDLESLKEEE